MKGVTGDEKGILKLSEVKRGVIEADKMKLFLLSSNLESP